MKKHVNIPIFIPHYGCPNDCVFCNQKKITGKPCFERQSVINEINTALESIDLEKIECELAFFGGSFTAIPRAEMLELLSISDIYLKSGSISSVRLSTRPDAITPEILDVLAFHGVRTIELGLQSFSEGVLNASNRGHTAYDSEKACELIKNRGFKLIGQMMIGLPSSTLSDELFTAEKICSLGCDGARIYPTVVFPDTELDRMYQKGIYKKLTLEEAVTRTAEMLEVFITHSVPVIRIGLCSNETLNEKEYAENYHAAIGELAINRFYLKKMAALLTTLDVTVGKSVSFSLPTGKISQAVGQKRANVIALKEAFGLKNIKFTEDSALTPFNITINVLNT